DWDLATGRCHHVGMRGRAEVLPFDPAVARAIFRRYFGPDEADWDRRVAHGVGGAGGPGAGAGPPPAGGRPRPPGPPPAGRGARPVPRRSDSREPAPDHLRFFDVAGWHACHAAFCSRVRSFALRPSPWPSIPTGLSWNSTARNTQAARYDPAGEG